MKKIILFMVLVFALWACKTESVPSDEGNADVYYTVTLDANGGVFNTSETSFKVKAGDTFTISLSPTKTVCNSTFLNKWLDGNDKEFISGVTQVNSDLVLYAQYAAQNCTVKIAFPEIYATSSATTVEHSEITVPFGNVLNISELGAIDLRVYDEILFYWPDGRIFNMGVDKITSDVTLNVGGKMLLTGTSTAVLHVLSSAIWLEKSHQQKLFNVSFLGLGELKMFECNSSTAYTLASVKNITAGTTVLDGNTSGCSVVSQFFSFKRLNDGKAIAVKNEAANFFNVNSGAILPNYTADYTKILAMTDQEVVFAKDDLSDPVTFVAVR